MLSALTRIAHAVGIEAGERRVFAWAAVTFFLIHAASVAVANASDTFFLKRIGVNLLPLAFLVSALLLVLSTAGVARLAARRPQMSLLSATFFALAAALLPLWLLALADVRGVFVVLVVISKQVESIAVLVFWVATGALLNARQAKRLYAPIVAGGTLGEIAGSFASAIIGRSLGIAALLPVAAVLLAIAGGLAMRVAADLPARVVRVRHRRAASRAGRSFGLLAPLWRDSDLFRILAAGALLSGTLGPMLYFQFAHAADLATRGGDAELRLLSLYAAYRGWLNIAVLALQLVGTARLFRRIGVPLAATLSPIVYLCGFTTLSLRFRIESAVGAMASATLQDHAIYDPAQQILVTLFPERLRPAATTLISGPVQRAGGVLGNLIVLAVIAVATPAWVAVAGLPIALLWLIAALLLWRIYPTLLLEVASARRLRPDAARMQALVDPGTQRVLAASLADADPVRVRAACALVTAGPPAEAATALASAAAGAAATTRPLLLDALHHLLERTPTGLGPQPEAARHLEAVLDDPGPISGVARARVVQAYAQLAADIGPASHAAAVLARLRTDPEPAVRLAAAARLRDAGAADADGGDLDAALGAALAGADVEARHVALDELRASLLDRRPGRQASPERWTSGIARLRERLDEPRDRARALEILADLAASDRARLAACADDLLVYATDPDPYVRAAAVRFAGHAHLAADVGWIVDRLDAEHEAEVVAAGEALRALGPLALETLLVALHRGARATRDAVLPILRDLRLEPATVRELIDREIGHMQHTVLLLHGLAGGASDLVLQRLRERLGEHLHRVLILLATQRDAERFVVLGRLLARTPQGRGRAVLLEALEALLPPDERGRIMPLLDDGTARAARVAAQALGRPLPSFEQAVREAMADADPLTVAFLAATQEAPHLADRRDLGDTAAHRDDALESPEGAMLSRVEIVLHLRGLHLFADLTTRQLSQMAALVHEESHPAGTTILREGEFGECMYLILSGEVSITRAGQYTLSAGPGELFGEMSLFDGEVRFATVAAARRVRLLRLERRDLFELMDEQPGIAIGICQNLARHARDSIRRLEAKLAGKE